MSGKWLGFNTRPRWLAVCVVAAMVAAGHLHASEAQPSQPAGDTPPAEPLGLAAMREFAHKMLEAGSYELALEAYRTIIRHTPSDPVSHSDLAGALASLRMYAEAADAIDASMAIERLDAQRLALAAMIYGAVRRHEDAFRASLDGAELGDTEAMFALVNMYEQGLGAPLDPVRAFEWAERAARAGHLEAMAVLERTYREGRLGQPADAERAGLWAHRLAEAASVWK